MASKHEKIFWMIKRPLCEGLCVRKEEEMSELEGMLDLQMANANCCRFNRWGTLVAVGATDGRVFIIDFLTRGVVKQFPAHVGPLSTLSWSRDGRTLLTGSVDQTIVVWNVLTGQAIVKLKYAGMILSAQFNPRDDNQLLVLPNGQHPSVESIKPRSSKIVASSNPLLQEDTVSCAAYDRRGKYVVTGTSKGRIVIFDVATQQLLSIVKQNSVQQVRNIVVPRRGCFILTNSQDRVIRRYDLDELIKGGTRGNTIEPVQKLSDIVNKAAWKSVCCSYDGEYICGASTKSHALYIWERANGSLIKILHGTKHQGEALHDVQWHPTRAVILSVANGIVSVWTQAHVENWSAFAPEFTELEENARYVEKEGEFDLEDEDASEDEKDDEDDSEDIEIDVVNLKADEMGCSSDEDDTHLPIMPTVSSGPLWFIPVTPEIENPEDRNPITSMAMASYTPYADINFLTQPASGATIQYTDPNDLRLQMLAAHSMTAASAKPMVKVPGRRTTSK